MNGSLRKAIQRAGKAGAGEITRQALQHAAVLLAQRLDLPVDALDDSRLGRPKGDEFELEAAVRQFVAESLEGERSEELHPGRRSAHLLSELMDGLLASRMPIESEASSGRVSTRRSSGAFFTPAALCTTVVRQALSPWLGSAAASPAGEVKRRSLTICDPALGGGAFLVECCVALSEAYRALGVEPRAARIRAAESVHGVDRSELAVAVAEVALWLYLAAPELGPSWSRRRFVQGDALCGALWEPACPTAPADALELDWYAAFPDIGPSGFDLVIGNPPWVAFAGRSAQPLAADWRDYYRRHFEAFAGFPTLHGLFVERAAALAPRGRVALLLPSALADLDGYRGARRALARRHVVRTPLTEIGQDAFRGVVQPSFVLIADAAEGAPSAAQSGRAPASPVADEEAGAPWTLAERARTKTALVRAEPPPALERLGQLPLLPAETFRELGFQSNRQVSSRLFFRGVEPRGSFRLPLLEGRNVREFAQDAPRLFLWDDPNELKKARCRLRPQAEYETVAFVVRQTAAVTIAARHAGGAFRNSLLAGFAVDGLDADLVVAMLNSTLFRALHLARQRDARQATFPQVKIGHLRRLPAPPPQSELRQRVRCIGQEAARLRGCPPTLRAELDVAVAELFGLDVAEQQSIERYLVERLAAGRSVAGRSAAG